MRLPRVPLPPIGGRALLVIAAIVVAVVVFLVLRGCGDKDDKPAAKAQPARLRKPPHGTVTIAWVGDMSLSTERGLPKDGGKTLIHPDVRHDLKAPDITVGNLEGTFGAGGDRKCAAGTRNCFSFQAPPKYAKRYRAAGFDVMNLANNHAFDYGWSGQMQTIDALNKAKLRFTGLPGQITVVKSGKLLVGFVGFAPYPWSTKINDLAGAREVVEEAGRQADLVVVVMHAGGEGAAQNRTPVGREIAFGEDRGDTRAFAHTVIDAGADLVLGSGPHVVRGIERYRGKLIAYSLGDFLGYKTFGLAGPLSESGILRVKLDQDGRFRSGRWISLRLHPPGLPKPDPQNVSAAHVARLSEQDFGRNAVHMVNDGRIKRPKSDER